MRRFDFRTLGLLVCLAPAAGAQQADPPAPSAPPASAPAPALAEAAPATPAAPAVQEASPPASAPAAAPLPSPAPAAAASGAGQLADVGPPSEPIAAAALPSLGAWLGAGSLWVPSVGLDPFAEDDALVLFTAGVGLALVGDETLGVAAVAGVDLTSTEARLRGDQASLGVLRLALGPELRGSILQRLFWHGRVSPTVTRVSAELEDSSSATLSDTRWVWGAEAALGLDVRFAETRAALPAALGFFLRVEGGYAWSPSSDLSLEAAGSDAPVRTQALELEELSLAGPVFRASVGLGF
jgi:hypothetical protein